MNPLRRISRGNNSHITMDSKPEPKHKHVLKEQLSSASLTSNFKGLTRRRRHTVRKISRVKQQHVTERYIRSMNENAQNDSKRKSERLKLLKFLWKDVKGQETENLNMTLDYDVVDLHDLDPQGELLKYAVAHNLTEVIAVLLRHGSPIESSGEDGLSPLHLAIKLAYIPVLAMILASDPPIDVQTLYEKRTALHAAVRINSSESLDLLLQSGADPRKRDIYGSTPLHLAARLGRDHLIKMLIEHGACVRDIDNEGWTAMHVAAEAGHVSSVRILLQNHSIVDAQSKYGKTPLHWACAKGHLQVVQALLDSDASLVIRASNNKTACDYAVTPILRNLLQSYSKQTVDTPAVQSKDFFDCRLKNKSLIDLLDLEKFQDPYAHALSQDVLGRGILKDELTKPYNRSKSMPYILDTQIDSDLSAKSPSFESKYCREASVKSCYSFASFTTVSESEIDFAMNPHCESLPTLSLAPIKEEAKLDRSRSNIAFNIGDSGFSDNKNGQYSPEQLDSTLSESILIFPTLSVENNNSFEAEDENSDENEIEVACLPEVTVTKAADSFECKVPIARLIKTLEGMHEQVSSSVDDNVDILSDVFRDVVLLRQTQDMDRKERENTLENIETNIKDIVVRLKELKVKFDGQILEV